MTEERAPYRAGPTDSAEPPLATEDLVAQAHAHRQGIPYETGDQWLERLPERLRTPANLILGGKMNAGEVAYALAALIVRIESGDPMGEPAGFSLSKPVLGESP
jgi:hypothetical protein